MADDLKDQILNVADCVYSDLEHIRQDEDYDEARYRIGVEIMALNALCNAHRSLNADGCRNSRPN